MGKKKKITETTIRPALIMPYPSANGAHHQHEKSDRCLG